MHRVPFAPIPARLSRRHQAWIYLAAGALFASGVAWLALHCLRPPGDDFGSPIETWCLRVHGAATMLFLVVVGALLPVHAARAWALRRNRRTGGTMIALVAVLALSGYLLYYGSGEALRAWISVIHWGLGLAAAPALVLHVVLGRRRAARAQMVAARGAGGAERIAHPRQKGRSR